MRLSTAAFSAFLTFVLLAASAASAQTLPLRLDDTVLTKSTGVFVVDTHAPDTAMIRGAATATSFTQIATNAELGAAGGLASDQVFGVALVPNPSSAETDILVAASSAYALSIDGAASANLYCINGVSGTISLFATLDNPAGGGIGDIAYNAAAGVLYATNVNDGVLVSFAVEHDGSGSCPVGTLLGFVDPFAPAFTHPGQVAPVTFVSQERLMAVGYNPEDGRVYWGRWVVDQANPAKGKWNRVYSSPTDPSGIAVRGVFPAPPWQLEVSLPHGPSGPFSSPPVDLAFRNGRMLIGSRSYNGNSGVRPGASGVVEYQGYTGAWMPALTSPPPAPTGNDYTVGDQGVWCSGGVDYNSGLVTADNRSGLLALSASDQLVSGYGSGISLMDTTTAADPTNSFHVDQGGEIGGLQSCGSCPRRCFDTDGDGVCAYEDNCLDVINPDQADADADGLGDLCDNCPGVINPGQEDMDQDGDGNFCDSCPMDSENDVDGDGVCFGEDLCPDTVLREILVPVGIGVKRNRWALMNDDMVFTTNLTHCAADGKTDSTKTSGTTGSDGTSGSTGLTGRTATSGSTASTGTSGSTEGSVSVNYPDSSLLRSGFDFPVIVSPDTSGSSRSGSASAGDGTGFDSCLEAPFTLTDTAGCSCEQILEVLTNSGGGGSMSLEMDYQYGCHTSTMLNWMSTYVTPAAGLVGADGGEGVERNTERPVYEEGPSERGASCATIQLEPGAMWPAAVLFPLVLLGSRRFSS